jgi:DNA-binding NtrC family response regulator
MVYGIVRNHEGQIEVNSEVGKGTVFTMYFPSSSQPQILPLEAKMNTNINETVKKAHIMIVDDDLDMLSVITKYLEQKGCSIVAFSDGSEAVEYFREQSGTIDLVLLDMIMPKISGQEVFNELRKTDSKVRVIFMSGYNDSNNVQELLSHENTAFIQKPFVFNDLSMIMYRIMASHIAHVQQQ